MLLVHECRDELGACDFDRFLHLTADDLIRDGLFSVLAVQLHASTRHLAASLALLALACGAHEVSAMKRAPSRERIRERTSRFSSRPSLTKPSSSRDSGEIGSDSS